jgi:DNA-binding protein H-NS
MTTLVQIQSRIKRLQAQAEAIIAKSTSSAVTDIRALMVKHGLTTADIEAPGGATRTGRKLGRPAGAKSAKKTAAAAKKSPSLAKGKLPAKYLNPKTGETWSGWARPPAWIKDVKDRTKFLIHGAGVAGTDAGGATVAVKKTVGEKTAAKKVAAKKAVVK